MRNSDSYRVCCISDDADARADDPRADPLGQGYHDSLPLAFRPASYFASGARRSPDSLLRLPRCEQLGWYTVETGRCSR